MLTRITTPCPCFVQLNYMKQCAHRLEKLLGRVVKKEVANPHGYHGFVVPIRQPHQRGCARNSGNGAAIIVSRHQLHRLEILSRSFPHRLGYRYSMALHHVRLDHTQYNTNAIQHHATHSFGCYFNPHVSITAMPPRACRMRVRHAHLMRPQVFVSHLLGHVDPRGFFAGQGQRPGVSRVPLALNPWDRTGGHVAKRTMMCGRMSHMPEHLLEMHPIPADRAQQDPSHGIYGKQKTHSNMVRKRSIGKGTLRAKHITYLRRRSSQSLPHMPRASPRDQPLLFLVGTRGALGRSCPRRHPWCGVVSGPG